MFYSDGDFGEQTNCRARVFVHDAVALVVDPLLSAPNTLRLIAYLLTDEFNLSALEI